MADHDAAGAMIRVQGPDGSCTLTVPTAMTLQQFKLEIFDRLGLAPSAQILLIGYPPQPLNCDESFLAAEALGGNGARVIVQRAVGKQQPPSLQLIISGLGGTHVLDMSPTESLRSVKQKLEPLVGCGPEELRLIVKGKTPHDTTELSSLGLTSGAKLLLMHSKVRSEAMSVEAPDVGATGGAGGDSSMSARTEGDSPDEPRRKRVKTRNNEDDGRPGSRQGEQVSRIPGKGRQSGLATSAETDAATGGDFHNEQFALCGKDAWTHAYDGHASGLDSLMTKYYLLHLEWWIHPEYGTRL